MKPSQKQIIKHLLFLGLFVCIALFWPCPAKIFFGIPCPGCGLTRAHLAALRLDFSAAFGYHPLFPIALPALFYLIHDRVLPYRFPLWAERTIGIGLFLACLAVYGYRMAYDPVFRAEGGVSFLSLILK